MIKTVIKKAQGHNEVTLSLTIIVAMMVKESSPHFVYIGTYTRRNVPVSAKSSCATANNDLNDSPLVISSVRGPGSDPRKREEYVK